STAATGQRTTRFSARGHVAAGRLECRRWPITATMCGWAPERTRDLAARGGQELRTDRRGGRPRPGGAGGSVLRVARAQRGGQVDDDADAHGAGARGRRRDRRARL